MLVRNAFVLSIACAFLAPTARAQIEFDAPRAAWVGAETSQAEVGDFDEDGLPDLVCDGNGSVRLLLSRDGSRFRAPREIESGAHRCQIEVGDLDGDSHLDVVIENRDRIVLRFGDGTGNFSGRSVIDTPGDNQFWGLETLRIGDVDGDGHVDLIRLFDDALRVLPGDGTGSFGTAVVTPLGDRGSILDTADFDGDGLMDVAVGWIYGTSIWLANRSGGFRESDRNGGRPPSHLVTGDWNGDGLADVAGFRDETIEALLGDGRGGFDRRLETTSGPGTNGHAIARSSEPGSSRDNLLVVVGEYPGPHRIVELRIDEVGRIETVGSRPVLEGAYQLEVSDLDRDGDLDWIGCTSSLIVKLFHRENGSMVYDPPVHIASASYIGKEIAAFDIDYDGDLDLLTNAGRAFRNDGDDRYVETEILRELFPSSIETLLTDDFTSDGLDDLFVKTSVGTAEVIPADASSTPAAIRRSPIPSSLHLLETGDIDGDGALDLIGVFPAGEGGVRFGRGDGTFEQRTVPRFQTRPRSSADFDGDGIDDILGDATSTDELHMVAGSLDRQFDRTRNFTIGTLSFSSRYDAGDLTGDGIADLVFYDDASRAIRVALSAEGRGLQRIRTIRREALDYMAIGLYLHDFDADGILDLAVSLFDSGTTGILTMRGLGHGRFGPADVWSMQRFWDGADNAVFVDIDQDGDDDVLQTTWQTLIVTKNRSRRPAGTNE